MQLRLRVDASEIKAGGTNGANSYLFVYQRPCFWQRFLRTTAFYVVNVNRDEHFEPFMPEATGPCRNGLETNFP